MNAEQNPLLRYGSLLEQYTDRVEPFLTQLRERVDNELDLIRQQETTLIVDRAQALQKLQTEIGVDARFLLKTARFQEFFEQHLNVKSKYNRDKTPQVDDLVANWSLINFDRSLRIFDYQEKFEPDDYDDKNTYASYRFNVKVAWAETTSDITDIQALAIYGFNNYQSESFADLAESVSWELGDFPDKSDPKNWLQIKEFSYLVIYCCLEDRLEVIKLLKDILLEIHISDNNGYQDLHSKISEKTWWLPYLEILPISVPYVLETRFTPMESSQQIKIEYQRVVNYLSRIKGEMRQNRLIH